MTEFAAEIGIYLRVYYLVTWLDVLVLIPPEDGPRIERTYGNYHFVTLIPGERSNDAHQSTLGSQMSDYAGYMSDAIHHGTIPPRTVGPQQLAFHVAPNPRTRQWSS